MRTDVRSNPFAGLSQADDAAPDPAYLAQGRREVLAALGAAAIATLLAAPSLATPDVDDIYVDPSLCASSWLNELADDLYGGGQ